ncbi:hypothetical protein, partial [Escherichia coli]|uniref:hypothetical protein n=1 Tax=Escherichia coli TaxID=562 RepID=UPI003D36A96E
MGGFFGGGWVFCWWVLGGGWVCFGVFCGVFLCVWVVGGGGGVFVGVVVGVVGVVVFGLGGWALFRFFGVVGGGLGVCCGFGSGLGVV